MADKTDFLLFWSEQPSERQTDKQAIPEQQERCSELGEHSVVGANQKFPQNFRCRHWILSVHPELTRQTEKGEH